MPQTHPSAVTRHIFARTFSFGVGVRLIDPFHDMAVALRHDGEYVTAIRGNTLRTPWTICPETTSKLISFIGAPLDPSRTHRHFIDQYWQCTHLMDLGRLAIRQTAFTDRRDYRVAVEAPDSGQPEKLIARVERNGNMVLCWQVRHGVVTEPAAFLGISMKGRAAFSDGVRADPDLLEAAMMLRRAILVFRGRPAMQATSAIQVSQLRGACYSFQPLNAGRALRTAQAASVIQDSQC